MTAGNAGRCLYLCRMKRFSVMTLLLCLALAADAQPRSLGVRIGAGGVEASYQHGFTEEQFLSLDLGLDLGYSVRGSLGGKVTGVYEFIWARPRWTKKGSWNIYAGPGISAGYVDDRIVIKAGEERANAFSRGYMIAVAGQVGLEYNFEIPLQLSLEVRPLVGLHISKNHIGFYDNGLLGFAPSLAIRYTFSTHGGRRF